MPAVVVAPAQADGEHLDHDTVARCLWHLDVDHIDVAAEGGVDGSSHLGDSTDRSRLGVIRRG
jgi:hypothetical protein